MLLYDVWLDRIKGLSPKEKRRLVGKYGGSRAVFEAGPELICGDATGERLCGHPQEALWRRMFSRETRDAQEQLRTMDKLKIHGLSLLDSQYPESLKSIADPPWMLYFRGLRKSFCQAGVAIVGARKSTEYGRWAAFELARKLSSAGIPVISGMACGVDAAAHRGALDGGAEGEPCTVAVLGCGVDICYPRVNRELMDRILQQGAVVSELLPGTEPRPYFFPQRNRIISGLSMGVAVAEAGLSSGSLITAELAAEQGREVYAVPGNINRPSSIGTNKLIRDGAIPIVVLDDLLLELGVSPEKFTESIQNQLGTDEKIIYNEILLHGELGVDQLSGRTGISVGKVNAIVTILEMKGILQTSLGKIFIAKI